MKPHFDPKCPLPEECRRVALEELGFALKRLKTGDIHQTRSRLKRLRALLKLAGARGDDPVATEQERVLRDAGRCLSESRDMEVCSATLGEIAKGNAGRKLSGGEFQAAHEAVNQSHDSGAAGLAGARRLIGDAESALARWVPRVMEDSICSAFQDSYKQCRRAFKKARKSRGKNGRGQAASAERMHTLRKRVKALWAQLCLLRDYRPAVVKALVCKVEQISDILGKEHDLVILEERLAQGGAVVPKLTRKLERLRGELDRNALALAARVLDEKPGAFAGRVFVRLRAR